MEWNPNINQNLISSMISITYERSIMENSFLCIHNQTDQRLMLRESEAFNLDIRLWTKHK